MKIVLVQLAHETCKVAVLEMLWEDVFCKFFVLPRKSALDPRRISTSTTTYFQDDKTGAIIPPPYYALVARVFQHPKHGCQHTRATEPVHRRDLLVQLAHLGGIVSLQAQVDAIVDVRSRWSCLSPRLLTGWNPSFGANGVLSTVFPSLPAHAHATRVGCACALETKLMRLDAEGRQRDPEVR